MNVHGIFCNDMMIGAVVGDIDENHPIVLAAVQNMKQADIDKRRKWDPQGFKYTKYNQVMYWHTHSVSDVTVVPS